MRASSLCTCTVHRCYTYGGQNGAPVGRPLSVTVYKRHQIDERTLGARELLKQAEDISSRAMDAQIADITAHLSASTLSDKVTGTSNIPGGRLWGQDSSAAQYAMSPASGNVSYKTTDYKPRHSVKTVRNPEEEVMVFLDKINREVDSFLKDVTSKTQSLRLPTLNSKHVVFPFDTLFETSASFTDRLETISRKSSTIVEKKLRISTKLDLINDRLQGAKELWCAALKEIQDLQHGAPGISFNSDHHFENVLPLADPVLQVSFFAILACQVVLGLSLRGCNFLLNMLQYIIHLTLFRAGPNLSSHDQKLLSDIPQSFRSTADEFHIEPRTTVAAVCPNQRCHATYDPSYGSDSPIPLYPQTCSFQAFQGGEICGTGLLCLKRIGGRSIQVPIKPFVRVSFKDWLGNMLSREGYEQKMDDAWTKRNMGSDGVMSDIFDGDILRDFKGADGQHFSAGGEGRYVFSLCVDGFNPLGNKQAGKSVSVGLVSLVCLNLPPDMRYKPENMFLYGIIPGPSEPPLDCLGHYIKFLVDEFLELWEPGVKFSQTSKHRHGHLVLCALICLVCDLIAARKTMGFAGVRHEQICAFCHCTLKAEGLNNIDVDSWRPRTHAEYLESALRYRNAVDQAERDVIVKETGIRWSELFRLPYFDPSRFVVVDAMHNLFLGLMREHFEILGIRLNGDDEPHVALPIHVSGVTQDIISGLSKNERKSHNRLIKILESPINDIAQDQLEYRSLWKKIASIHRTPLDLAFAYLPGISVPLVPAPGEKSINKNTLAHSILHWRVSQQELPESKTFKKGSILTADEVAEIRADISRMRTPSWLASVPSDLGQARHGKLKADQWRVLGTTYLPVSLMRIWGKADLVDDEDRVMRRKVLEASISLVSAIRIATLRTTSRNKSALYRNHMLSYLSCLQDIVPDYNFHPNHHMALHLGDYLCRYGPVYAWWTFPFERVIGMLQRIPTNFKSGELEETITKSFIRAANLRALILKVGCPEAIKNCGPIFSKLANPDIRNTVLVDMSSVLTLHELESDEETDDESPAAKLPSKTSRKVSADTLQACRRDFPNLTISRTLQYHKSAGRVYCKSSRHLGNSSVFVRNGCDLVASQIQEIVQTTSNEVLYAVRPYRKSQARDPFLPYPILGISLWAASQKSTVIVPAEDIMSHFAWLEFATECDED